MIHLVDIHGTGIPEGVEYIGRAGKNGKPKMASLLPGMTPETLTAIGRDVECVVLARAVKWFVEHRILLNGHKTIVFK